MFIVARRLGQRIEIGEDITVTVTELSRNSVKLGIIAPRNCLIVRGELKESVALANREAVKAARAGSEAVLGIEAQPEDVVADFGTMNAFVCAPVRTLTSPDVSETTIESTVASDREP
jgi:carbon storage regulator